VAASPTSSRVQTTLTPKACIHPALNSSTRQANSTISPGISLKRKLTIHVPTIVHKSIENQLINSISDKRERAGWVPWHPNQKYLIDLNKTVVVAIIITVHRAVPGLHHRKLSLLGDRLDRGLA